MNRDQLSLYKNSNRLVYIIFIYFDTQIIVGLLLFVILFGSKVQLLDGLRKYSLILNNKSSTSIYVGRTY